MKILVTDLPMLRRAVEPTTIPVLHRAVGHELIVRGLRTLGLVKATDSAVDPQASPDVKATPSSRHTAETVLRKAQLVSVGNWIQGEVDGKLDVLKSELVAAIRKDDPHAGDPTQSKNGLQKLFDDAQKLVTTAYAQIKGDLETYLKSVSQTVDDRQRQSLRDNHGIDNAAQKLDTKNLNVLGLTMQENFDKLAADFMVRFKSQIRIGTAAGDSLDDLILRIVGDDKTVKASESDHLVDLTGMVHAAGALEVFSGIMDTASNSFSTLITNAISAAANAIENGLFDDMGDDDKKALGIQWVCALEHTCFPAGQRVLTSEGYKPIEKIKIGDLVFGGSGQLRNVTDTMSRPALRLACLKLSNGREIICTPEHRFLSNGKWIEASALTALPLTTMIECEIMVSCDLQNELIGSAEFAARLNCEPKQMPPVANFVPMNVGFKISESDAKELTRPAGRVEGLFSIAESVVKNSSRKTGSFAAVIVTRYFTPLKQKWNALLAKSSLFARRLLSEKAETFAQWNVVNLLISHIQVYPASQLSVAFAESDLDQKRPRKNFAQKSAWVRRSQRPSIGNGKVALVHSHAATVEEIGNANPVLLGNETEKNVAAVEKSKSAPLTFTIKFLTAISVLRQKLTGSKTLNRFAWVATKNGNRSSKNTRHCSRLEKIKPSAIAKESESTRQKLLLLTFLKFVSRKNQTKFFPKDTELENPTSGKSELVEHGVICESVKIFDSICEVFDITVDQDHSFIIGGVVAHNCQKCLIYDGSRWDADLNPVGDAPEYPGDPPDSMHPNCQCQTPEVDLDDEAVPSTKLDDYFSQEKPDVLAASFGKASAKAFLDGDIDARAMMSSGFKLSPDAFARLRPQMETLP